MSRRPPISIRKAILRGLFGTVVAVLSLAVITIGVRTVMGFQGTIDAYLDALGNVFTQNLEAPLSFDDKIEVVRTLKALEAEPRIRDSIVFDSKGHSIAVVRTNPKGTKYSGPEEFARANNEGHLFAPAKCYPIVSGQLSLGHFCMAYDSNLVFEDLLGMILLMGAVMLVGMVLAYILSNAIQRPVSEALGGLLRVIQKVRLAGGYTGVNFEELKREGNVLELNLLRAEFNQMIELIGEKEQEILSVNANLENLVDQRTRELGEERALAVERSKFASLGEMAGGIAHEINNPLAIIRGLTEQTFRRIDSGRVDADKMKEVLQKIVRTTDRIAKIVKGLRAFARDGSDDPIVMTPVKSIIEDTLDFCEARIKNHGIEFRIKGLDTNVEIPCRSVQISQVILNFINNSIDAVEGKNASWIELEVIDKPDTVQIQVTDSGTGIPFRIVDKIFDPFFTTKPVGRGTGLGLAISTGIAKNHGGQVWYDRQSANTRFVLELPKHQSKQTAA